MPRRLKNTNWLTLVEDYTLPDSSPDRLMAEIAAVLQDFQMPAWMQEDLLAAVKGVALRVLSQDCPDQSRLVCVWLANDGISWTQYGAIAGGNQPDQEEGTLSVLSGDSLQRRGWGNFVVEKTLDAGVGESIQSTQLVDIYLYLE
jgi:hypothetical protein